MEEPVDDSGLLPQVPGCPGCKYFKSGPRPSKLLLYQSCRVEHYCGRDHQKQDLRSHSRKCKAIRDLRSKYDVADLALRRDIPARIWETTRDPDLGQGDSETFPLSRRDVQDWYRVRLDWIDELSRIHTYAAQDKAHTELLSLLAIDILDTRDSRNLVAALKLRLGLDTECFVWCNKWSARMYMIDLDKETVEETDEDMFGKVHHAMLEDKNVLPLTLCIMLVKIRLVLAMRDLQNYRQVLTGKERCLPAEIWLQIRDVLLIRTALAGRKDIFDESDIKPKIERIEEQIAELYHAAAERNRFAWVAIVAPYLLTAHLYDEDAKEMGKIVPTIALPWKECAFSYLDRLISDNEGTSYMADLEDVANDIHESIMGRPP